MLDYFSHFFSVIFFRMNVYSFSSTFIYKIYIFTYTSIVYIICRLFFISLWFSCYSVLERILIFFVNVVCCCIFASHRSRGISTWSAMFKFFLWHLYCNKLRQPNIKPLPFIDVSNLIWYLERRNWKIFSITSSSLSLIISFMLSSLNALHNLHQCLYKT